MEKTRFSSAQVASVAGIARSTFDAWLLRGYLPLPPGPGTGKPREYTLLDAIRLGVLAQLSRLSIPVGTAAKMIRTIEHRMLEPHQSGPWHMIIGPAQSVEASNPGRVFIAPFEHRTDAERAAAMHLRDPEAFIVVDLSRIVERVTAALQKDSSQAHAA